MTPLAHQIVKQLTLPLKDRPAGFAAHSKLARRIAAAKCFDFRAVENGVHEFTVQHPEPGDWPISQGLLHLPAKTTWLEGGGSSVVKSVGLLIAARKTEFDAAVDVTLVNHNIDGSIDVSDAALLPLKPPGVLATGTPGARVMALKIMAVLSMINSPRKFRHVVEHPHAGLARNLGKSLGMQGKFPLQATTKVVLWDRDLDDEDRPPVESGRTFKMPLHFVRAHRKPSLSARMGREIEIESYWAGDSSLGIRNSDYEIRHRSAA